MTSRPTFNLLVQCERRGLPVEIYKMIFQYIKDTKTFISTRSGSRLFAKLLNIDWYCNFFKLPISTSIPLQTWYMLPNGKWHGEFRQYAPCKSFAMYDKGHLHGDYFTISDDYCECVLYDYGRKLISFYRSILDPGNYSIIFYCSEGYIQKCERYTHGVKVEENYYEDGMMEGLSKLWALTSDQRVLRRVTPYKKGIIDGEVKKYNSKGRLVSTTMQKCKDVEWRIQWWPNENIKCILPGKSSQNREGRSYYSSGQLWSIKYYDSHGDKDGPYTIFHKKGFVLETGTYKHGRYTEIRTIYDFFGRPKLWFTYGSTGDVIRTDSKR